ncbi:hypothetical protein KFK09_028545 [Dendrobium nobile]|uniref:Uncharacterized protein n=1 Tax=Dendrobium nobile TaxID=94219 RepID=A0A8T3A2X4_DENNO|nr:hypothetical protein KFK09_028545 [Dendrobium nobile]
MNAEKSQKLHSSGAIRPLFNLNRQELLEELKEYYVRRKEQDLSQGQLAGILQSKLTYFLRKQM